MPKKEALTDENLHIMKTCFSPELAKKVHRCRSGTGTSHPKGSAKAKSKAMGNNDLKEGVLGNANG
jgi:hypothetical protein